jgi:hypothetical protein
MPSRAQNERKFKNWDFRGATGCQPAVADSLPATSTVNLSDVVQSISAGCRDDFPSI